MLEVVFLIVASLVSNRLHQFQIVSSLTVMPLNCCKIDAARSKGKNTASRQPKRLISVEVLMSINVQDYIKWNLLTARTTTWTAPNASLPLNFTD